MKKYDYKKAKQIIEENKTNIRSATLGMCEDWGWTSDIVFEDNKFEIELNEDTCIAGINGSSWATPVLLIEFNDGIKKKYDCYIDYVEKPDLQMKELVQSSGQCELTRNCNIR